MNITEPFLVDLFCEVDDFCQKFMPMWESKLLNEGDRKRLRKNALSVSEIITILIHFHQANYRHFKGFYEGHVRRYLSNEFPNLLSYTRFVSLMPMVLVPMAAYQLTQCRGENTGIGFIDSTRIIVCLNKRISRHKVFKGWAQRGKTSTGWFYGFKLHLAVNERGEILSFQITPGNVDDREPVLQLMEGLTGKFFADKGYISLRLCQLLRENGVELITGIRKNMKNKLIPILDKLLLRKRSIIETINDQLKNISQIEHTRHRSATGFWLNLLGGLIAYARQPKKPSIKPSRNELNTLEMLT